MGYSCSTKANLTLTVIHSFEDFDYKSSSYKYFWEIGRENDDGSITGTIYELIQVISPNDRCMSRSCKKLGSFKIDSQGKIVRFPGLSKRLWGVAEIASIEAYDRQYAIA